MKDDRVRDFFHKAKVIAFEIAVLVLTLIAIYKLLALEIASLAR
jgi:hypothetical protein